MCEGVFVLSVGYPVYARSKSIPECSTFNEGICKEGWRMMGESLKITILREGSEGRIARDGKMSNRDENGRYTLIEENSTCIRNLVIDHLRVMGI